MKAFNKVGDTMKLGVINFTGHCQSSWPIDYQLFFKSQYRLFAAFFCGIGNYHFVRYQNFS